MFDLSGLIESTMAYCNYRREIKRVYRKCESGEEISDYDKFRFYQARAFIFYYRSLGCRDSNLKARLRQRDGVCLSEIEYYFHRIRERGGR